MKKCEANLVVKVIAILIALGFLCVYWLRRDLGRYAVAPENSKWVEASGWPLTVVDTQTGNLFACTLAHSGFLCTEFKPREEALKMEEILKKSNLPRKNP